MRNFHFDTKTYYSFDINGLSFKRITALLENNIKYFERIDKNLEVRYKIIFSEENELNASVYIQVGYVELVLILGFFTIAGLVISQAIPWMMIFAILLCLIAILFYVLSSMKNAFDSYFFYKVEQDIKVLLNDSNYHLEFFKHYKKPAKIYFEEEL